MIFNRKRKILIVGLGLMGGSYADALSAKGYEVGAIARRQETIDYAIAEGLISHGQVDITPDYVGQFDIIVFGLYPHTFLEWIEKYQDMFKSGAVITDVTGVKTPIVYKIQEILRDDLEFIAAHPMAGKESSGVENASMRIFYGANYIVTPTDKNTPEAIELCKDLGEVLGFARITELSPEKHDEMIAFLSQLTHCLAVSLMTCRETDHLINYTGDSFRDLTRIAKINDSMWSELFLLNKDMLLEQMDLFENAFHRLYEYIKNDEVDKMREMMRTSTKQRELFDKRGK